MNDKPQEECIDCESCYKLNDECYICDINCELLIVDGKQTDDYYWCAGEERNI